MEFCIDSELRGVKREIFHKKMNKKIPSHVLLLRYANLWREMEK